MSDHKLTSAELRELNLTEEEYHILSRIVDVEDRSIYAVQGVESDMQDAIEMLILSGLVSMPQRHPALEAIPMEPIATVDGIRVNEAFSALADDIDYINRAVCYPGVKVGNLIPGCQ
tara:strand:- start:429 stop:779 length:351 start_codon:yes stop_codon:yes gene_type:complete